MRVMAITVGAPHAGSTRFRLMQYQPLLESLGITLEAIPQQECDASAIDRLREADVVINQKCLLKRSLARAIIKASRRLIFDFDDAIYTRPGKPYGWLTHLRVTSRFHYWLRAADKVTVANQYLANAARRVTQDVEVIPMAVDLAQWSPKPRVDDGFFRIGWVGAPNNLVYLERLDGMLTHLTTCYPHVRIAVFCGKKPALSCPFDYVPFVPGGEVAFIQQLNVGLLPLDDDEYSRGKSPIKAIQYLACGVPVVGNIYGATGEICHSGNSVAVTRPDGWVEATTRLLQDPAYAATLGSTGRSDMLAHHDSNAVGRLLSAVLCS